MEEESKEIRNEVGDKGREQDYNNMQIIKKIISRERF